MILEWVSDFWCCLYSGPPACCRQPPGDLADAAEAFRNVLLVCHTKLTAIDIFLSWRREMWISNSLLVPIPLVTSEFLSLKLRAVGMPLLCNLSLVVQVLGLQVCFLKRTHTVQVVLSHALCCSTSSLLHRESV